MLGTTQQIKPPSLTGFGNTVILLLANPCIIRRTWPHRDLKTNTSPESDSQQTDGITAPHTLTN